MPLDLPVNDDERRYDVVRNDEDQYSLWPSGRTLPAGWTATGTSGTRAECLEHIREVWTDLRPRSLRAAMEA
jgi:MbtH protein